MVSGVWLLWRGRSPRSIHSLTLASSSAPWVPGTVPRTGLALATNTDKNPSSLSAFVLALGGDRQYTIHIIAMLITESGRTVEKIK